MCLPWSASARHQLHWLPIKQRIAYKIATVTFHVRQTGRPSYLYDETEGYRPTRVSRSASAPLLQLPPVNTGSSSRVFVVWNSLDINTRSVEGRKLKTELFRKFYDT